MTTIYKSNERLERKQVSDALTTVEGRVTILEDSGGFGDLIAANNLSDVDNIATARANLNVDVAGTDNSPPELTGPDFTYTSEVLTRIDYDDGSYKTLSYDVSDRLDTVDHVDGGTTVRKEFFYGVGGELDYITQTTL